MFESWILSVHTPLPQFGRNFSATFLYRHSSFVEAVRQLIAWRSQALSAFIVYEGTWAINMVQVSRILAHEIAFDAERRKVCATGKPFEPYVLRVLPSAEHPNGEAFFPSIPEALESAYRWFQSGQWSAGVGLRQSGSLEIIDNTTMVRLFQAQLALEGKAYIPPLCSSAEFIGN